MKSLNEQINRIKKINKSINEQEFNDDYLYDPGYYEKKLYNNEPDDEIDDFFDDETDDFSHDMDVQHNINYDDDSDIDGESDMDDESDMDYINPKKSKINPHVKIFSKARGRKLLNMILNGDVTTDNIIKAFDKRSYKGKIINDKKEYNIIQALVHDRLLSRDGGDKKKYRVNKVNSIAKDLLSNFENFYKYCVNILSKNK